MSCRVIAMPVFFKKHSYGFVGDFRPQTTPWEKGRKMRDIRAGVFSQWILPNLVPSRPCGKNPSKLQTPQKFHDFPPEKSSGPISRSNFNDRLCNFWEKQPPSDYDFPFRLFFTLDEAIFFDGLCLQYARVVVSLFFYSNLSLCLISTDWPTVFWENCNT